MVDLRYDGDIVVDDQVIGCLEHNGNHLMKIEINHQHQNKGYGTAAVKQYLEQVSSEGYELVATTPATSPAMMHVFENLGFQRVEDPSKWDFLRGDNEERYFACYVKTLSLDND